MTTELLTKLDELNKAVSETSLASFEAHCLMQRAKDNLRDFMAANGEALESWRKLLGVPEPRPKRAPRSDKGKPRGPRAEAAA